MTVAASLCLAACFAMSTALPYADVGGLTLDEDACLPAPRAHIAANSTIFWEVKYVHHEIWQNGGRAFYANVLLCL